MVASQKAGSSPISPGTRPVLDARRQELRAFLRARRAAILPHAAGIAPGAHRRLTPGLRREEVAILAGVGVTWYTWLEQGRDIRVSPETLARIAKVLRLSATDVIYLSALAGEQDPPKTAPALDQAFQPFLAGITTAVAMILNGRFDVVAWNGLANALFELDRSQGRFANNHLWRAFMDPKRRRMYPDFETHMPPFVGLLRANYAAHIGDPEFEELVHALRNEDAMFERMWTTFQTAPVEYRVRSCDLTLPHAGTIQVSPLRFVLPSPAEHVLFCLAPANERSAAALASALAAQLPLEGGACVSSRT